MPSFNFDALAGIYDATRGYPRDVAARIARVLDEAASAGEITRFLEIGVGTGRIGLPLATLGRAYTGIDISKQMLTHLERKLQEEGWEELGASWGTQDDERMTKAPEWLRRFRRTEPEASMRLAVADVHQMPFRDASFDAVVAVHVLHLVDNWRLALQEVRRVLAPNGVFLHCGDERGAADTQKIREQWRSILLELGYDEREKHKPNDEMIDATCAAWGWQVERWQAFTWEQSITPRQVLEGILRRDWSSMRRIPDDIFAEACKRIERWTYEYFGAGIDTVRKDEQHFIISRYRAQSRDV